VIRQLLYYCTLNRPGAERLGDSPSMTHMLPPNLLRLFTPRPAAEYVTPLHYDKDPFTTPENPKKQRKLTGVTAFLERVKQEAADKGEATDADDGVQYTLAEQTKREIRREEKKKRVEESRKLGIENCAWVRGQIQDAT
jgi:U1 small nuclear ribonucleoprotein 70kDa